MTLVPGAEGRQQVQLEARVSTNKLTFEVETEVTFAVAADATRIGDGRISNAIQLTPINENGTDMVGECSARAFRLIGEKEAGQAYPATLLPTGAIPIGTHPIREIFDVNFADPQTVGPSETAYREADPMTPTFAMARLIAAALNSIVDPGTATVTLGNVIVRVYQHYDPARQTLPLFTPRVRNIASVTVAGANPDDLYRLPTRQRVALLQFSQIAQLANGGRVPVSDIFTALRLIGDDGRNIVGPGQVPFRVLVNDQAATQGGEIADDTWTFALSRFGRMSSTIVPEREYPNFRAEINDAPSATGTTSQGIVVVKELIRRAPVGNYATVMPANITDATGTVVPNPEFPSWAR
jgi:hypothetical protein